MNLMKCDLNNKLNSLSSPYHEYISISKQFISYFKFIYFFNLIYVSSLLSFFFCRKMIQMEMMSNQAPVLVRLTDWSKCFVLPFLYRTQSVRMAILQSVFKNRRKFICLFWMLETFEWQVFRSRAEYSLCN